MSDRRLRCNLNTTFVDTFSNSDFYSEYKAINLHPMAGRVPIDSPTRAGESLLVVYFRPWISGDLVADLPCFRLGTCS